MFWQICNLALQKLPLWRKKKILPNLVSSQLDAKESINIGKMDQYIEHFNFFGPSFGLKKGVVIAKVLVPHVGVTHNSILFLFSLWIKSNG